MNDEKYVFISEVKERKNIARSARNRRSHNGKGGKVMMPSDRMTRKEWESMNGEVKHYKINEPMSYAEFKALPDDIKKIYIKTLRSKFDVPDKYIAEMMGVGKSTIAYNIGILDIHSGETNNIRAWDRAGWQEWVEGRAVLPEEAVEEVLAEETCESTEVVDEVVEEQAEDTCEKVKLAPRSGEMMFEGSAAEAFEAAAKLLGDGNYVLCIRWEAEGMEGQRWLF